MEQTNAVIYLNPERLDRPLRPIFARQLHSAVLKFAGVPEDCASVVCRVFNTDGATFYDIPCAPAPDGTSRAYIIGTCFPAVGVAKYEIHAYDAEENPTALGEGEIRVLAFSTSSEPVTPGEPVIVTRIPDANGVMHTISAVSDGAGGYTSIIDYNGEELED